MKFIHVADVHLGVEPKAANDRHQSKSQSGSRASEIWDTFLQLIKLCENEKTDLLLIAGDLFHRQPLLRELKEVNYLFSTLTKTKVVLIAGNHDYIKKNSYYRNFKWNSNVHMFTSRQLEYVEIPSLDVAVYGLSYHAKEIPEPLYDHAEIIDDSKYHILLAHGGDEKHIPFRKRVLEAKGFDYVALGHIHKPQALIRHRMEYAGSLEPTDINDLGPHGFIRGELTEEGCTTSFVKMAKREYVHLTVEVEEHMSGFAVSNKILSMMKEREGNPLPNYFKITLEGYHDPEVQFDYDGILRDSNILELVDHTKPAYDFYRLFMKNDDNLLGKFIHSFGDAAPDSVEYDALCEGVEAFMETRRRQS